MEALGHPDRHNPNLHIAGTNGKGSVGAFCTATLQAQAYKVGRFTSPHLAGALAGISINHIRVKETDLEQSFELMLPHLKLRKDWTQFEVVTALMFLHFARAKVDAAVIEVGLGGRLDATNVLKPLVSVITPIDYDHMSILGNSLAEIAREKAGIIKKGVPLVIAPQPEEARASIVQIAEEKGVDIVEVGKDVLYERVSSDLSGQVFDVWNVSAPNQKTELAIQLLGAHQIENAATAFAALQTAPIRGLPVSEDAIRRGFAAARWPGRFEMIQENPPVVLDAAHSPAAAQALRASLDEYFPGRSVIMILGVSVDKDLAGIIETLRARIDRVVATQSKHMRAMPANELRAKLVRIGIEAEAIADAKQAVMKVMDIVKVNEVVLVCGSVFLVELVRDIYIGSSLVDG